MHTIKWSESSLSFSTNVCRLCANLCDVLVPVYSKDEKERLDCKIKKCLPIVIRKDDEKPKQICVNCVSKLKVCSDLVDSCLAAEFKFESALQARASFRKESSTNGVVQCAPSLVIDQRANDLEKGIHLQANELDVAPLFISQQTRVWDVGASLVQSPKCGENDVSDCSTHEHELISTSDSISAIDNNSKDQGDATKRAGEAAAASLTVHTAQLSSDGVIVLGKTEGIRNTPVSHIPNSQDNSSIQTQAATHQVGDSDCQDILVMVELKYKDVLVTEHRVEASSSTHLPAFTSEASSNQQDIRTVSIEANASSIPSSASLNNAVMPQATVVLDASRFKSNVAETIQESNSLQSTEIILKPDMPPLKEVEHQDEQPLKPVPSDKPFSCDVCGKSFMRRTNLNAHMGIHTKVKPHCCDLCGKCFVVRWDLTLHKRIHSGLYSCEFCGKAFSVKGKLERHRRVHTGERPFSCDVCTKAFGDKRNLEAHRRCHTGEKPFSCKVCGRSFRVNSHLSDHRRVHSQEKPFTCHVCGKSFKWKSNLNIHLKLHSGEHYTCEVCGRDFARKADLQKHYRGHTGDKPFPCDVCDKRFGDRASLQKHSKCHSEEKPHTCDVCGKSFLFVWYLNAHKKTHFEEKSYPCVHCGKIFSKKGNFVNHKKWHSGEKSILCEACDKDGQVNSLVQ